MNHRFSPIRTLKSDVGGQRCPCPILVSFLSGFPGKSCQVSVCFPESVRIFCQETVRLDSVRCLDSVRILEKKLSVACLFGQGRDRAVRIFTVLVRRGLIEITPSILELLQCCFCQVYSYHFV